MKTHLKNLLVPLALIGGLIQTQTTRAAVAFTVTPAAVSNTYSGKITLQITGLTNTETVVVQKFFDANTNGVIDAGDSLWQQFNLKDGKASVFYDGGTGGDELQCSRRHRHDRRADHGAVELSKWRFLAEHGRQIPV